MARNAVALVAAFAAMMALNIWSTNTHERLVPARAADKKLTMESVQSAANSTIWEIRKWLAVLSWNEAQSYFHEGYDLSAFSRNKKAEEKAAREVAAGAGLDDHDHDHGHAHGDDPDFLLEAKDIHDESEIIRIRSLKDHPFLKRGPLRPYVFKHSDSGRGAYRMMPFYWLTTQLNPAFVRAYTNGAWWLGMRFKKPQQALDFLADGIKHNPHAYPLYVMRGQVNYLILKDYKNAVKDFQMAIELNPKKSEVQKTELWASYRFLCPGLIHLKQYEAALNSAYAAKRIGAVTPIFDEVISDATRYFEGHPLDLSIAR